MRQLEVHDVPDDVVSALERRATSNGRSVEAEHRKILLDVLRPTFSKQRLLDALQGLPFDQADFDLERSSDVGREVDV